MKEKELLLDIQARVARTEDTVRSIDNRLMTIHNCVLSTAQSLEQQPAITSTEQAQKAVKNYVWRPR